MVYNGENHIQKGLTLLPYNQSPVYKGCGCFWHNLNETVASDSPPKGMVNIKNNQVRGGGIRYD